MDPNQAEPTLDPSLVEPTFYGDYPTQVKLTFAEPTLIESTLVELTLVDSILMKPTIVAPTLK